MGRGSSGTTQRYGGGGLNPADIVSTTDMISERNRAPRSVQEVLQTSKEVWEEYGENIGQFVFAELKPKAQSTIAYWDGERIGLNTRYADVDGLNAAYADTVKSGFHPSNGNRTGTEAVAAHEFGHALTDAAADRMGLTGINKLNEAANRIVAEARKQTSHRGVVQMAKAISTYATQSNAEAIAEAYADVFCNRSKAKAESRAIINVLNSYIKRR